MFLIAMLMPLSTSILYVYFLGLLIIIVVEIIIMIIDFLRSDYFSASLHAWQFLVGVQ